ncbi:MAG TPA: Ig-like domain-containing protein [Polyangia bacterium]|jgi:hypothetical protein
MRLQAAIAIVFAGACTTPSSTPAFQDSDPAPLAVTVTSDPPPAGGLIARDATVVIALDDFPDPDTVSFGPVLLRSGRSNFDADLSVDLVGRAIRLHPRALLAADTEYEVVVQAGVAALDGRQVAETVVEPLEVGATLAGAPAAPPPVTYAEVAPILTGCAPFCHSRTGASGAAIAPARQLDLTGDPADPVFGLIDVPSVGLAGAGAPLLRVAPHDSARSVLLRKLLGGNAASKDPPYPEMGVDGRRMPLNLDDSAAPPLDPAKIALIEQWIDDGASR